MYFRFEHFFGKQFILTGGTRKCLLLSQIYTIYIYIYITAAVNFMNVPFVVLKRRCYDHSSQCELTLSPGSPLGPRTPDPPDPGGPLKNDPKKGKCYSDWCRILNVPYTKTIQYVLEASSSPGCSLSLLSAPALLFLPSTRPDQAGLAPPVGGQHSNREETHQSEEWFVR